MGTDQTAPNRGYAQDSAFIMMIARLEICLHAM